MAEQTFYAASEAHGPSDSSPWSCFPCRQKKVRCDRCSPCSNCSKSGVTCSFPVSGRMPTRRHDPTSANSAKRKQVELLSRLRHLEGVVEELSSQLTDQTEKEVAHSIPVFTEAGSSTRHIDTRGT